MDVVITGSVGNAGVNKFNEVKGIQILLNFWRKQKLFPEIAVDGYVGPKTINAIKLFQKTHFGWSQPDGTVDPKGDTLKALNSFLNQAPTKIEKGKSGQRIGNVTLGRVWPNSDGSIFSLSFADWALLTASGEYELSTPVKNVKCTYVSMNVAFAGKVKLAFFSNQDEFKIAGNKDKEIALSAGKKVTDSLTAQIGSKLELKDLMNMRELGLKGLVKKLLSAVEASLEYSGADGSLFGVASLSGEVAFSLGNHPIAVKVTIQRMIFSFEFKDSSGQDHPIGVTLSGTFSFAFGPTHQLMSRVFPVVGPAVGPALGVSAAMLSLTALGLWDYGRRLDAVEKRLFLQNYVNGYEGRILGDQPGLLPIPDSDPQREEKLKLKRAGQADADSDANTYFSGLGLEPWVAYNYSLSAYARAKGNPTDYAARQILRQIIWTKLAEKYAPLDMPRFEI